MTTTQKGAILYFPKTLVDAPLISRVIRQFDVEVNILQASITQAEDGRMFALFRGTLPAIEQSLQFLRDEQIRVILPPRNLLWDEELCVHCGACVGQCFAGALSLDDAFRLQLDDGRCRACELCVAACSYGALEPLSAATNGNGNGQDHGKGTAL